MSSLAQVVTTSGHLRTNSRGRVELTAVHASLAELTITTPDVEVRVVMAGDWWRSFADTVARIDERMSAAEAGEHLTDDFTLRVAS